ncbi:unnamed protein product [Colias eurytheme]|nr:unnamed protein product [Colias eurytheme]
MNLQQGGAPAPRRYNRTHYPTPFSYRPRAFPQPDHQPSPATTTLRDTSRVSSCGTLRTCLETLQPDTITKIVLLS